MGGEPLWASDSVKRKETKHCSQGRGAPFGGSGGSTGVPEILKVHFLDFRLLVSPRIAENAFFEISDVLFCAQESQNSWKDIF